MFARGFRKPPNSSTEFIRLLGVVSERKIYAFIIRTMAMGNNNRKKDDFMPAKLSKNRKSSQPTKCVSAKCRQTHKQLKNLKKKQINSRVILAFSSSLFIRSQQILGPFILLCLPFHQKQNAPFTHTAHREGERAQKLLRPMMMMMDVCAQKRRGKSFSFFSFFGKSPAINVIVQVSLLPLLFFFVLHPPSNTSPREKRSKSG